MEKKTFYEWLLYQNILQDIHNQNCLVGSALTIKDNIDNLENIPKEDKWLLQKIEKQLPHRGCLRERSIVSICDEILDPQNSSSLLHYAKSPRKQGVEHLQRQYVKETWGIEILSGKNQNLTPHGKHSIRMTKDGDLLYGARMNRKLYHKSFDGKIFNEEILVFQKVTTDDGGSTDSVFSETYETIMSCIKFQEKNPTSDQKFVFLLDGPYWERKDQKNEHLSRFEKLKHHQNQKLIISSSNTIFEELK